MPHIFDLSNDLRFALTQPNAKITPRVILTAKAKVVTGQTPGGFPIFSTNYYDISLDISDRIEIDSLGVNFEKQLLPSDGDKNDIGANDVTITVLNTDGHFATTQDGSIIQASSIEAGTIIIYALVQNATTSIHIFTGRITGIPQEQFGKTIFTAKDYFWDAIRKPLVYETMNGKVGNVLNFAVQNSYVSNGALINYTSTVIQGSGFLEYLDGYCCFTEDGEIITTVDISDTAKVDLYDITIKNLCPLGKFEIFFMQGKNFRLTIPDGSFFYGDTDTDFDTQYIKIKKEYWNVLDPELAKVKITWQVQYTVYGNPISIIKNLLEKGFLQNWGAFPSDTTQAAYLATSLRINWESFNALENQWKNYRVFFSETNKDNKVFEKTPNNRPLNVLTVCQRIADHIGASIIIDANGEIAIQSPKIGETILHPLSGSNCIIKDSLQIESVSRNNYIVLSYGRNDRTGNYGAKKIYDLRADPAFESTEYVLNLPYYKAGKSKWKAEEIAQLYLKKILRSIVTVSFSVTPHYGISLLPGDRFQLYSTQQPILSGAFEVISISKGIAGTKPAQITAVQTQDPEGHLPTICDWIICGDELL